MPEVLEVRTTDDIELEEPFAGTPPAWRRVLGVIVVVALALGGAYSLFMHPGATRPRPLGHGAVPRTGRVDAEVLTAADAALADWGRFGVSGDLSVVTPAFDNTGPQFARLRQEAGTIGARPPGPPPYTFVMVDPQVLPGTGDSERIVRAQIVVSRPGERDQQFQWDLVLHRGTEDQWSLWTVRDRDRKSTSTATPTSDVARATGS